MSLLTVTFNPALDVSATVAVLQPDRKMHCSDLSVDPGGGGVNVARVAVRLGVDAVAAVLAGGPTGERFLTLLAQERVPTEIIPIAGEVRESFTAKESSSGRQYRFVLPGPTVTHEEWGCASRRITTLASKSPLVVLSGSLPGGVNADDLADLMFLIQGAGADMIVDGPAESLRAAARVGVVFMKPSLSELSSFAGRPLQGHYEIEWAARELLKLGPSQAVIVSLAGAGALLVEAHGPSTWIHAPHVQVVSTVGAGDSLVAGAAVTLLRGGSMLESACYGVAAGSAATLAQGTDLCQPAAIDLVRPLVSVSKPQGC